MLLELNMMKMVQVTTTFCVVCMAMFFSTLTGLYNKLAHLTSNSLIDIANDVTVSSIIPLVGLSNITILGHNNPTVYCNDYGGLHFMSCYNCTIEGITWKGCGGRNNNSDKNNTYPVLQLSNSSNIVIKYCLIQNSIGQALVLSGMSGDVIIEYCRFLYNKEYRGHGTAIHYTSSVSYGNVTVANCEFSGNIYALSVVYFGPSFTNNLQTCDICIRDSSFYCNKGVPIYLSNQKLHIYGKMEFVNNTAKNGGGIYISNYSEVIFQNTTSANFVHNVAYYGGAIYLTNYSSIMFKNNPAPYKNNPFMHKEMILFHQNIANSFGKDIYAAYHSNITFADMTTVTFDGDGEHTYGSALYAKYSSRVTFKGSSEVTFKNNQYNGGGALHVHVQCEVVFRGNTTVKFHDNIGIYDSGAMYINHSFVLLEEQCNVSFNNNTNGGALYIYNSFVRFEGSSTATFSNNGGTNGGALFIKSTSAVIVSGKSMLRLHNNQASNDGGAAYVTDNSIISFEGNSIVKINNNKALNGGALYIFQSDVVFQRNATVTFGRNEVFNYNHNNKILNFYGGALYTVHSSTIMFQGSSKVNFIKNNATCGGAVYSTESSIVKFQENSTVMFNSNEVNDHGGAMYAASSTVLFEGNSAVAFANNIGNYNGGAVYIEGLKSTVRFEGNCTAAFNNNTAYNNGGAAYFYHADITFAGSSKVSFRCNNAVSGGAVHSFLYYYNAIMFTENSTILFDSNKGNNGGAISLYGAYPLYIENYYSLKFYNFSNVTFTSNEAVNGGAVYIGYNSNIISHGNSTLVFRNNKAHTGGSIYTYSSNITFQGDSSSTFSNNLALQNGGVLFSYTNGNISFAENCTATFTQNEAVQGGIIYIQFNSAIKFQGNSAIIFTENKAIENGGVIHSSINSFLLFDDHASIYFHSNVAKSGGVVNLYNASIISRLKSNVNFNNNSAEEGGALYIASSNITFTENSSIQFINNTALQDGGAIYLSDHTNFLFTSNITATFSDNFANDDGKDIYVQMKDSLINFNTTEIFFSNNAIQTTKKPVYINVPKSCNRTCLLQRVTKLKENMNLPIVTSPKKLIISDPAICINTDCNKYYISNIMLGQEIRLNACVFDYYDQPTELTQFLVTGMHHQHYNMSGSKYISVLCDHTTQGISITGNINTVFNYSINLSMYAAKTSGSKIISVNLTVELSQCHPGFYFSKSQKCECYNTKNIISCSGSSSTIKRGYWFGSVNGKSTVASCPMDYCNFTCCEISNGIYHLSPLRENQCRAHRYGTTCGNCKKGYTLSFDSPECINMNTCTVGQTVLVIALSLLYWVAVIVAVFIMMYFKVAIGSLYAIAYYYSVVDILLRQASFISNGLYTTINIMSSLAKLTPQFLGELCLLRNMSGIDQQFIHYVHPIVISLILVMISVLARKSSRISSFISRGIIHFICFLLLLSYTSMTTTSLLLMRSLTFEGIDEVYTYLSPDVEYFHGRHLAYVIMAVIFTITVVIGLPLLLFLEPFINSKINFVKIKPLLDQFQASYKDKYRYFAAYYMICRIVIITLVIIRGSDDLTIQYVLISVCVLMALIHLIVRPYADKVYNIFDGIILQLIVIISVLPIIEFTGSYNEILVVVLVYAFVVSPITSFLTIKLWLNKSRIQNFIKSVIIKYKHKYNTIPTDDDVEISPINETTVHNCMRTNVTVVEM